MLPSVRIFYIILIFYTVLIVLNIVIIICFYCMYLLENAFSIWNILARPNILTDIASDYFSIFLLNVLELFVKYVKNVIYFVLGC